MINLAEIIASKITDETQLPELVIRSLKAVYSYNQIKYIRGKIALSSSYFFSHKDIFNIKEAVCLTSDNSMIFVIPYANLTELNDQLTILKEEFSQTTRISDFTLNDSQLQFTDRKNRKVLITPGENYLLTIIGAKDAATTLQSFITNF